MGIDNSWGIIQGLSYEEWLPVVEKLKPEDADEDFDMDELFYEFIDNNDFSDLSPYYDSECSNRVYGVRLVHSDWAVELDLDAISKKAKEAFDDLLERFGVETKTYGSQDIW